MVINFKMW